MLSITQRKMMTIPLSKMKIIAKENSRVIAIIAVAGITAALVTSIFNLLSPFLSVLALIVTIAIGTYFLTLEVGEQARKRTVRVKKELQREIKTLEERIDQIEAAGTPDVSDIMTRLKNLEQRVSKL